MTDAFSNNPLAGGEGAGDSHEFPFLKTIGEALKSLGSGVAEAFKGQAEDAVHDVTDPVQKLKALAKVLNELAEKEAAKKGGEVPGA